MNIFSNQGVSEESQASGEQKYIYGGVYHKVIIKEVVKHTTKSGKDCLRIAMYTEDGGPETARNFDFYFTDKAADVTKAKLKHIATKVAKAAVFDNMPAKSLDEYITNYGKIVTGKTLRIQFNAEQYQGADGSVKDAPRIGLPVFAEATQPGAEHPPVADEDTALVYDKNDPYQYKKLDVTPDVEDLTVTTNFLEDTFGTEDNSTPDWLN